VALSSGAKLALVVGFGGLLALMAAAGWDSVRMLGRIEARKPTRSPTGFLNRNRLLERIRDALYLFQQPISATTCWTRTPRPRRVT